MTTDEVILRRDKAAANGEPFTEPPPRLRGQSAYLAVSMRIFFAQICFNFLPCIFSSAAVAEWLMSWSPAACQVVARDGVGGGAFVLKASFCGLIALYCCRS
ncbi:uncharacterized protein LOC128857653 [Anastrepha ludens]|uniref:uncharacterized protein LOC128857653 n=1 Tax=Anastrepha ludens TaxID=28586 RepID=UPI0023B1C1FD|nr:uncharacterized protein LOC128857653 [Anastrepha ludens]